MNNYYSALDKTDTSISYKEVDRFEVSDCLAFRHDIKNGLPREYDSCDLLYTEIPWEQGYTIFNNRADKEDSDYDSFLASITQIINENKTAKAIVILCSKKAMSKLPEPHYKGKVNLNGYPANLLMWNCPATINTEDYQTLIKSLTHTFYKVGDFCCGYGNTGRIFVERNRSFVMSDINPRCIGFIAQNFERWVK